MKRFRLNSTAFREQLIQRKISIAEAARRANIPQSTMFRLVHSDDCTISIKTLARLHDAFGEVFAIEDDEKKRRYDEKQVAERFGKSATSQTLNQSQKLLELKAKKLEQEDW